MTAEAPSSRRPITVGRILRRMSVASLLALVILAVAVTSVVAAAAVGLRSGEDLGDDLLLDELAAVQSAKVQELEAYFAGLRGQSAALASGPMALDAVTRFGDAYDELAALSADEVADDADEVVDYYLDEFVPALSEVRGQALDLADVVDDDPAAIYLQRHYLADSPAPRGQEDLIADAEDGSAWSDVHDELHGTFRDIAQRLDVADLYLIEPERGSVVYSVTKSPDFATSADLGPWSGTALSSVVEAVRRQPDAGSVTIADLSAYGPALDQPTGFMASPILDGDELAGVLVLRFTGEWIDRITTSGGDWAQEGLGDTGEAYLVGSDGIMRSVSRAYVEDPGDYLDRATTAGSLDVEDAERVGATGTTTLVQQVTPAAVADTDGEEPSNTTNYLGDEVFTLSTPIEVDGLDWVLVTEVERDERGQRIVDYRRDILVGLAVLVIVLTFLAVAWSNRLIQPVRGLSDGLRRLRSGESEQRLAVPDSSPQEFEALAERLDGMVTRLHEREAQVTAASAERHQVLASLVPPAILRRVEAGDRGVLEQIPGVTVVVIVVGGLGRLAQDEPSGGRQAVVRQAVDELDELAGRHGLEPFKVLGDAYFASCGADRPYLDHAPRSAHFAVEARSAIDDVGREWEVPLEVSIGLASGPVTIGLAGSARLMYDVWGDPVTSAHYLARAARPGQILTSTDTRDLLPPTIVVESRREPAGTEVFEIVELTDEVPA